MTTALATRTFDPEQLARVCRDCGHSFPATREYFHKGRGGNGLSYYCKSCANARARAHHYQNHEKRLAYLAEYRRQHREELRLYKRDMDKARQYHHAYRIARGDELRSKARKRYQHDKQSYVERAYRWQRANPEKARAYTRLKAWRRRGVPMDNEARAYVDVISQDPCVYCGRHDTIVIDHIQPISHGGTSTWMNLAPACRQCNAAKTDKTLLSFLLERID